MNLLRHHKTINAAIKKMGGMDAVNKYLQDELVLVEKPKPEPPAPEEPLLFSEENLAKEEGTNFEVLPEEKLIIQVNKSIKPRYPDWAKVIDPELDSVGLAEYDVSKKVKPWLHVGQYKDNGVKGTIIYDYLNDRNELKDHLGLADLLAIQAKGVIVFRKLFPHNINMLFGWKSVVRNHNPGHRNGIHHNGGLSVPYLNGNSVKLRVDWLCLSSTWFRHNPGLRFK